MACRMDVQRIVLALRAGAIGALCSTLLPAQELKLRSEVPPDEIPPPLVKIYSPGHGTSAPTLIDPAPIDPLSLPCSQRLRGKVKVSAIVDEQGVPRNLYFIHPAGSDLDKLALRFAESNRFHPSIRDGQPVPTAIALEIELRACRYEQNEADGTAHSKLWIESLPEQKLVDPPRHPDESRLVPATATTPDISKIPKVGDGISAPVTLNHVEAGFPPDAGDAPASGACLLSLTVDSQGMPRNIELLKSSGPAFAKEAFRAASLYRFTPAMQDGEPVPVRITVSVSFRKD